MKKGAGKDGDWYQPEACRGIFQAEVNPLHWILTSVLRGGFLYREFERPVGFCCKLQQFTYGEGAAAAGCYVHTLQPPAELFTPGVEGRTRKQGRHPQGGYGNWSEVSLYRKPVSLAKVLKGPVVELFAVN